MRSSTLITVAGVLLFTLMAHARVPQATPAFDVASVKEHVGGGIVSARSGRGSLTIVNQSARSLIINAYGVRRDRVVGGPDWVDSSRFDVTGRAPDKTPDDQLAPMLRTLLADRFKLVVRTETRDQPVYALVLPRADGRLGPNLRPSTDCEKATASSGVQSVGGGAASPVVSLTPGQRLPCGNRSFSDARGATMIGGARTLAELARALEGGAGRVVQDRTGLNGTFDFQLRYASERLQSAAGGDSDLPTLFTAVQEQLGLKLESARGQVEFLVIDRIERPTPD